MKAQGFDYAVIEPPLEDPTSQDGRGVLFRTPDSIRANGYGVAGLIEVMNNPTITETTDDPAQRDANAVYAASLSQAEEEQYALSLFGSDDGGISYEFDDGLVITTPGDGCIAEARQTLYGDLTEWLQVRNTGQTAERQLVSVIEADDEFVDATTQWSECLRNSGFTAAERRDVADLAFGFAASMEPDDALQMESQLAEADASCLETTGLPSTARSLERKYSSEIELLDLVHLVEHQRKALASLEEPS